MPANGALREPQFAPEVPEPMVTVMPKGATQPEGRHVTRPAGSRDKPFLSDDDLLQVTNDMDKDIDFRWGGKHYVVPARGTEWVIFQALVNQLGDPRSVENATTRFSDAKGNKGIIMSRYDELSRLFAIYAVEQESLQGLVEKAWKVRVETMHGDRVHFPCQLPDMPAFPVALVEENRVNSDVTRMFDQVNSENTELRDRIARMEELMDTQIREREGVEAGV